MSWLNKYRPQFLVDFKTNLDEIKKAQLWIEDYKKDSSNCKKVLLIMGDTGTGKTVLADVILKQYNYQKIELNSTDVRSKKKINEFLIKSLTYKNVVDMFNEGNLPIGILIDEIDTICNLSDKGGFNEFLDILKMNNKCESINQKKKTKKTKILAKDYIKLYNPIICTSNNVNDKKINELKKFSEVIYLKKSTDIENIEVINYIYTLNNQNIDENVKIDISNHSQGDIRRLILLLEDLYVFASCKCITKKMFSEFKKTFDDKEEDIQLFDSTKILLTENIDVQTCQRYFDIDCLLTPLMLYHNSVEFIKNTENTFKQKLNTYKNILESLCIHDTIQTNIFEIQDWDELYDTSALFGAAIPNYHFNQLKNKKDITIEFTSLLNKISQMYVNKKLLNSAKFSIGKINYDTNEIIYLTEIISNYFNDYKNKFNEIGDDDDENEDDEQNQASNDNSNTHVLFEKPLQDNSNLIVLMNQYNMNIEGLENLLKIEKLNQINEKRKKKFTIKIKKEISKFLISQI